MAVAAGALLVLASLPLEGVGASWFALLAGLALLAVAVIWLLARGATAQPSEPERERTAALGDHLQNRLEKLKDLQWEISDSEARYRALLDAQTDIIIRCDTEGRLTFVNKSYCRTFGVEAGAVLGTVFAPEVRDHEGDDPSASEAGRRQCFEQLLVTAAGPRWFAFERLAIAGEAGRAGEIQFFGRDVTEQRRTQQALAEARDQAEAANHAKSRFLAAMSHEIRTPMNGILGMTSLLVETPLTPEQKAYLSAVELSAKNLLRIIDEILDLSKIEAGKLEIHPAPFALDECLRSVIELMAPRAQEKRLDLAWRLDPDLPRLVTADETRVRQILLNLIGNAIKFTDVGGVALRVSRGCSPAASVGGPQEVAGPHRFELVLEVEDTGGGIAADQMRSIFAEFEQADDVERRKRGGTGLGLAISRSFARAMGGDIEVRSTLGRGSTFTARIQILAQPAAPTVLSRPHSASAQHVLIVSSRVQQRTLMHETLLSLGLSSTVASPAEAIAMTAAPAHGTPTFDVIVADAEEGPEAIGRLVDSVRTANGTQPRAMLVVDQPGGHGLEAFWAAGCDAYLVRPVRPTSLLAQLAAPGRGRGRLSPHELTSAPRANAALQNETPHGRRILLVEDNAINALLASRMSERAGCVVHHAASGAAALSWCESLLAEGGVVDLVLMDIHMPDMDGFETARRVREIFAGHGRKAPPIVTLTANAFPEDRKRCLEAGFDDYLAKPFDRSELEALFDKWCAAERAPRDGALGGYAA